MATAVEPSSACRWPAAFAAASGPSPERSGGAAIDAVCRVSYVARSTGVPKCRRETNTRTSTTSGSPTVTATRSATSRVCAMHAP